MAIIDRLVQVTAKEESVSGTPESFSSGNVLLSYHPHQFIDGLDNLTPFRRAGHLNSHDLQSGQQSASLNFSHELLTSGMSGTPPAWGLLLCACGFAPNIAPNIASFNLTSEAIPSLSLGLYLSGISKTIWGARGRLQMIFQPRRPGLVNFEFTGAGYNIFGAPLFTPVFDKTEPPILQSITLGAEVYHLPITRLKLTLANKLTLRPAKGAATGYIETLITDRNITIDFDPEMVAPDTFDYYSYLHERIPLPLTITLGTVTGNTITITTKSMVLEKMSTVVRSSLWAYQARGRLLPHEGNDEVNITFL